MKKFLLLIVMLFMVCGCGEEISNLDITKATTAVEKTLVGMEEVKEDLLKDVYGMNLETFSNYVFKSNMNGEVYAIIKSSDKSDTKEQMDKYFSKVREYNTAYSPEQVQKLDDRLEKEIGDYLIYIVSDSQDKVYQDIIDTME